VRTIAAADSPPTAQFGLAEIAEVTDAKAVECEAEDRVRAALGAGDVVVFGSDGDHLAYRRVERACGRAQDLRRAADDLDGVVVAVLMGDEHDVRVGAFNRRVVELHSRAASLPSARTDR
jgi:hypothetical protein